MTARKTKAAEIPLLVQLARGEIVKRSSQELHVILENLSADHHLDPHMGQVLERLLVTMGQLVVRFIQYTKYPARVVLLSQRFNSAGFYSELIHFLHCDEAELDFGYSLPLRKKAWDAGGVLTTAIGHLTSRPYSSNVDNRNIM